MRLKNLKAVNEMKMPGFNADSSLYVSTRHYRGGSNNRGAVSNVVFPSQIGGIPCVAACVKFAAYNTPPGSTTDFTAIVATCASICGIPYSYQLYTNVMAIVFPVGGAAGAAGGISLWWLIPGAIVGTIIGGAAGLGIEWLLTPDLPQIPEAPTCRVNGLHYVSDVDENFWGYSRASDMAKFKADKICAGLPQTYCAGACSSGLSCRPKEQELISNRTSYGFWTHIYYKFACTCGCR